MFETIPLFPLNAVLFPSGRMSLRIFEPRYLDLVSSCLKSDSGFGLVHLQQGAEVNTVSSTVETRFEKTGTYAKIIDFDDLGDGKLSTTIEGKSKFRITSSWQEKNGLYKAEIDWVEEEEAVPLLENFSELTLLLNQLMQHQQLRQLKFEDEANDVSQLSFLLSQYLPIDSSTQYKYLLLEDPVERIDLILDFLEDVSQ